MICSTICAGRYIFCLFKKSRVKFFFLIIHNALQSATKFVEPLFSAALKNELKNLPHLETQYHYNTIPFPAFRLIYQEGGGGVKVRESRLKLFRNVVLLMTMLWLLCRRM